MIRTLQSTRNSRLINSLSSNLLSNRTGSSFSNTISGSMANLLSRFSDAMVNPFPKIPSVPYVVPLTITSTITMVETGNTSARSADRPSHPAKWSPLPSGLPVLIAAIPWLQRKTAGSSVYTNVSIPDALTISITSKRWIRKTLMRIMVKTNISFITSIVSSL